MAPRPIRWRDIAGLAVGVAFVIWIADCRGVEITPGTTVEPYRIIHVTFGVDGFCDVIGIVNGRFAKADIIDIDKQHIAFVGPPGQYMVSGMEGGKRFQEIVTITGAPPNPNPPGPQPEPDNPDPVEPLSKLATMARDNAKSAGIAGELAESIAKNFESVSSAIAAGGIKTPAEAQANLARLNVVPRSTEPFFNWLNTYLNANEKARTDVKFIGQAFTHIAIGLRAAK